MPISSLSIRRAAASGRFFNFNGTAGIWRKDCIVSAGGWQHDTLTEDLDLSYRAQLAGWKFIFLPEVVTPAEIPVDMDSFKSQQHRWSKGGIETAKKLLPLILRSSQPWRVKLESLLHLSCNLNYLLVLLLAMLAYPALIVRIQMGWKHLVIFDSCSGARRCRSASTISFRSGKSGSPGAKDSLPAASHGHVDRALY